VRRDRLFAAAPRILRCAPASNLACGQVVELGLSSAGSSNYRVEPPEPTKSSQARDVMVRPERFELPASWFVVA
jgi:hypothetical protein